MGLEFEWIWPIYGPYIGPYIFCPASGGSRGSPLHGHPMLRQRELPEAAQTEANGCVVVAVGAGQGAGDLEETQRLHLALNERNPGIEVQRS